MKNFLRSLKYAWAYRVRVIASVICAVAAAAFWSLNFTAIYPVLKILGTDQSLQEWVDQRISENDQALKQKLAHRDAVADEAAQVKLLPGGDTWRSKREFEISGTLAKLDGQIEGLTSKQLRYQQLRNYFIRFLPKDRFETLAWLIGFVVLAVALKGFFEFCQDSLVGSVMNRTLFDLRNRFYRNVIHLDVNDFKDEGSHELMARFTNDMSLLGEGIKTILGKVIAEPLRALGCILVACWISWQLTLMFLVLVPVALFILTKVSRMMKRASRRVLEQMSSIYKILQETFTGIRVVKAFTMEPYERRKFRTATQEYYHKAMQVVKIDAAASPIIELLGVAAVAIALLAGAYLVLTGETHLFGLRMTQHRLEAETLLQLYALLAAIADPVRKLSSVYTKLQSGAAAADRIFAYMDRTPRVTVNSNMPHLPRHQRVIEFHDVCYSYRPGEPILSHIHLEVAFGETVAVVGRNGCGKTTLCGLLPRFYDPDHGRVTIDGFDLRQTNLRSLRKQIGVVTQEVLLFDDTIYNNIAYANRQATPEQVEAASRQAFAHEFILAKPDGYQTRLGEGGAKLSGGQKQRLALARAILRDPSILILDEFTSQVDAESQTLIQDAIRDFVKGRTTFIITHSLSTLRMANRIIVVDKGHITGAGTHAELIQTCDLYRRLYDEVDRDDRRQCA